MTLEHDALGAEFVQERRGRLGVAVQPAVVGDVSTPTADAFFSDDDDTAGVGQFGTPAAPGTGADEQSLAAQLGGIPSVPTGERDMPMAIVVGLALAAMILAAMWVGPAVALVVVTVALGLGAVEFFNAVRVAGYQPAVLLGLTAIVMLPLAVYWRGEAAIALVLVLALVEQPAVRLRNLLFHKIYR